MNKWLEYERQKRVLRAMDLSAEEYERKIAELAKRLRV